MKRNWLNSFWSKGRKKIEENRSRCLGDLKKNQRMGSHRWFLSLTLRFRNSKFPVKLNWATIEFPIILNLEFSDLEKIACILRRLYIYSLCSFTFVFFQSHRFYFLLLDLRRVRDVYLYLQESGMKKDARVRRSRFLNLRTRV